MYETKKGGVSVPSQAQQEANPAEEEEEEDMIQNDVEEPFGDSVFIFIDSYIMIYQHCGLSRVVSLFCLS